MYGCFQTPGEEIHYTGFASIKAKKTRGCPKGNDNLKIHLKIYSSSLSKLQWLKYVSEKSILLTYNVY